MKAIDELDNRFIVFILMTIVYIPVLVFLTVYAHTNGAFVLSVFYALCSFTLWRSWQHVARGLWDSFVLQSSNIDEEQDRYAAFRGGMLDAQSGERMKGPHDHVRHYRGEGAQRHYVAGYQQAVESYESILQRREEAAFAEMCDLGKFPTRAHYLAFCRKEAESLREEERPYVRLVRGPDMDYLSGTSEKGRKGPPVGLVMLVRVKSRRKSRVAPFLQVGASFCNPAEANKFDRHEAFMRAHNRLTWVPGDLDPELAIDDPRVAEFYAQFPKSCRPMLQTMLNGTIRRHAEA